MSSSRKRGAMLAAAAAGGLGILLLVGAGSLARTAPARGSASGAEPLPPPTRSSTASVSDLVVSLSVGPNRPGVNQFTVQAASSRRPPPAPVAGVMVELPGARIRLERTGPDAFSGTGQLRVAGPVRITATISRAGRRIAVPVAWSVEPALPPPAAQPAQPAPTEPATDSDPALSSIVDILLVPLLGALVLLVVRWARRRRPAAPASPPGPPGDAAGSQERVLEGVR